MNQHDTPIVITIHADLAIADMQARVLAVADQYGRQSEQHVDMLESLMRAFATVFRNGGVITRDGELGLYGVSGFHYGIVFHRHYLPDGNTPDPLLGTWESHS